MNRSAGHNLFEDLKLMSFQEYKVMTVYRKHLYTYIIYIDGFYKIGSTKDVKKRLLQFNTHCAPSYRLLYIINKQLEPIMHLYYEKYRVRGDWFCLPENINLEADIIHLDNLVKKYKNLPQYKLWSIETYKEILDENING